MEEVEIGLENAEEDIISAKGLIKKYKISEKLYNILKKDLIARRLWSYQKITGKIFKSSVDITHFIFTLYIIILPLDGIWTTIILFNKIPLLIYRGG